MPLGLASSLLSGLMSGANGDSGFGGEMRGYAHAAKTMLPNQQGNAGRYKFLFHVAFNINTNIVSSTELEVDDYSYMVKSVDLPKFTIDLKEHNQYNRKKIVQTKIKYDPITITFHDDNAGRIRSLWDLYYTYYFADGRYFLPGYTPQGIYTSPQRGKWGLDSDSRDDFFQSIEIHSFHAGRSQKITLINPFISNFSHDTHDYAQGEGIMEHRMTIEYSTVKYEYGYAVGAPGFADPKYYDVAESDISGGNAGMVTDKSGRLYTPTTEFKSGSYESGSLFGSRMQSSLIGAVADTAIGAAGAILTNQSIGSVVSSVAQNAGSFVFPSLSFAEPIWDSSEPTQQIVKILSDGDQLDTGFNKIGAFPLKSWERSLEEQGYDPNAIEALQPVMKSAIDDSIVNNNSDAIVLARDYIAGTKEVTEKFAFEPVQKTYSDSDLGKSEANSVNLSWKSTLTSKGYSSEDITYADGKIRAMRIMISGDQSLSDIAEGIINQRLLGSDNV